MGKTNHYEFQGMGDAIENVIKVTYLIGGMIIFM